MDFTCSKPLSLDTADYAWAANTLSCEVAAILAVVEIEAPAGGYLHDGRPTILFESRWFNTLTKGKWRAMHPGLSTTRWVNNYGMAGAHQYDHRLKFAMELDEDAALQSCSWGKFQILGVHYRRLGFASPRHYVEKVVGQGEQSHLHHFVRFVQTAGLAGALQRRAWPEFAYGYNGAGYQKHRYDERLERAYRRFKRGDASGVGRTGKDLQKRLVLWCFLEENDIDGIIGPHTTAAVKAFQADRDLTVDGITGPTTWSALMKEKS